jgi:hypothetical protein
MSTYLSGSLSVFELTFGRADGIAPRSKMILSENTGFRTPGWVLSDFVTSSHMKISAFVRRHDSSHLNRCVNES